MSDPRTPLLVRHLEWLDVLPPGWHRLYVELATALASKCPDVEISQARQKFAAMRVYIHPSNELALRLCRRYELRSLRLCEVCGERGRALTNSVGWYRALCPKHSRGFRPQSRQHC